MRRYEIHPRPFTILHEGGIVNSRGDIPYRRVLPMHKLICIPQETVGTLECVSAGHIHVHVHVRVGQVCLGT